MSSEYPALFLLDLSFLPPLVRHPIGHSRLLPNGGNWAAAAECSEWRNAAAMRHRHLIIADSNFPLLLLFGALLPLAFSDVSRGLDGVSVCPRGGIQGLP